MATLDRRMEEEIEDCKATIAEVIRSERTRRGWSLQQLADELGISKGFLHDLETGDKTPNVAMLFRLGKTLEKSFQIPS